MDFPTYVDMLDREGQLLGQAAAQAGWHAKVPSCPEWTCRDLVRHIGQVHRWAATHVLEPRDTDDIELVAPPEDADLLRWYTKGHARLTKALAQVGPDAPAWHFLPAPSGAAFWARRQAHETAIHRVDAELAAGTPLSPFDPRFAADGVDEVLSAFYARRPTRMVASPPLSFRLVANDIDRTWRVVVGEDGPVTTALDQPAQVVVSAPAADLYLLVWNRVDHHDLVVDGDRTPLDVWRDRAQIVWG